MVSFNLVKIAALLCTSSVVAGDDLAALAKKIKWNRKKLKRNVKTIALMNEHMSNMTTAMDEMVASYDERIDALSSLLGYTATSCCDSSVPSSSPSFIPSASPTKTLSYVPTGAPSKSSQPTATCVATDIGAISGVSTKISTIAMHGNYMLVGNSGANEAELFMRQDESSSWSTVKTYTPSMNLDYSSKFGDATAIDDQHIVITSRGYYTSDTGRLFIYDRATDAETILENPGSGGGNDLFGNSVALFGNIIVVGAKFDDTLFSNSGIVYIYEKNAGAWEYVQALTSPAPTADNDDYFGVSVAYDGDLIVVGASGAGEGGAAYVYGYGTDGFEHLATIEQSEIKYSDNFGMSVATSGGVITIGAPYYDEDLSYRAGAVYFYSYDSNQGSVTLLDKKYGAEYNSQLGYTLAMEGNRIAVSSYDKHIDFYMLSTTKTLTLLGTMTSSDSYFGGIVAFSKNSVVSFGGASYSGQTLYQQIICGM